MTHIAFAKIMASALFLMYGATPFILNILGVYEISYAYFNLIFSIFGIAIVFLLPSKVSRFSLMHMPSNVSIKQWLFLSIFVFSFIFFILFPWHEDRESIGSSFSAIFRAAWLFVMFTATQKSEKFKIIIFILSLFLMFIDESRTYFMIGLLAITSSSVHRKFLLLLGIGLAVLLAATRMSVGIGSWNFLTYGIVGESYNAVRPVGQILAVSNFNINSVAHLAHTMFQPIIFPVEFVAARVIGVDFPSQSYYFSKLVETSLGEKLSPMGGWYIVADFIYYGYLGLIPFAIYLFFSWWMTCKLFNTNAFPYGAFIFFISIKSTPYVYWKMVFYILVIFYIVKALDRIVLASK